jgi:putative membrane-bound dehydrogenase-like protein
MLRLLLALAVGVALPTSSFPQEPAPKAPNEALRTFKLRPGFTIERMAAEPLVMDPIAFAWGPDGKFWVVEMGDYPLGTDGKGSFGGRVKFLTRKRGDGPYDTATIFLDKLGYPSGVTPYGNGVIITCAPDIFYAEDTDGDGKADKKEILFTGFVEGNQQHRVNGLVFGLDGWYHGANGDSGGVIKSLKTGKTFSISGRDFRLKPDDGRFDPQSGQTQFGRSCDDWGNWFGNNNSNPMFHFALDDFYLRRNPYLVPPSPRVQVSIAPGAAPVYPASKTPPRFNDFNRLNHFTSACSAIVYRDELFGKEFTNNTFVSEPVHNLVHREILSAKGVTFTSKRADDEQSSEFLASTDNWFRPTMIQTGPDGALWIADMYRHVIEHPQWIPKDWQAKLDLRAGHDMGRIYRVYPKDVKPRPLAPLHELRTLELIYLLESPNGWTRDMAHQILLHRNDPATLNGISLLMEHSRTPVARAHALSLGRDLFHVGPWYLLRGMKDSHPGVRRWAVKLSEPLLRGDKEVLARVLALAGDNDAMVRMQVAYSLGQVPLAEPGETLATLALKHPKDEYMLAAIASSLNAQNFGPFFEKVANADMKEFPGFFLATVYRMVAQHGDPRAMLTRLVETARQPKNRSANLYMSLSLVLDACRAKKSAASDLESVMPTLWALADDGLAVLKNPKASSNDKVQVLGYLGRVLTPSKGDLRVFAEFLTPHHAEELQLAALQGLTMIKSPKTAEVLLESWKGYAPRLRAQVLDTLLSRDDFTAQLLEQMERKKVLPLEIDASRRQRILEHKNASLKKRAAGLFAEVIPPERAKVLEAYRTAATLPGDSERGAKLFTKTCAACHQYTGMGPQVGPDIAAVKDKSPEGLLIAILDPNRAVEARYINYLAVLESGQTVTGLIASETSTSLTLVGADGKRHEILRRDLQELTSTGKSVMPEGVEKDLSQQDIADIIAFVARGKK